MQETISQETAERLTALQKRCILCNATYSLHIHHRIFRSEGEQYLSEFLSEKLSEYCKCYEKDFVEMWGLHDIQNLCVLCQKCHESLHRGRDDLRQFIRNSFTCSKTGFNIPFYKDVTKKW